VAYKGREMESVRHYFFNSTKPITCNTHYGSLIYKAKVSFNEGEEIKNHQTKTKRLRELSRTS
jgi:hypothetical protein